MRTNADYLDGTSSQRTQARLEFNDNGTIELNHEGRIYLFHLSDVSFSSRLGNTPRVLRLPDNAVCYIADNDLVDAFLKRHDQQTGASFIHIVESRTIYVLAAVLFTAIFTWSMVTYGIPYMSSRIAHNLPADVDQSLGKGTLDTLDKLFFEKSQLDEITRDRLLTQFDVMKSKIAGSNNYKMIFRRGGKIGANAFALPSGIIVITDELVELSENDNEVVAIIAHEIGHLIYRHSVRMVLQDSAVAVLVTTITGDPFSTSSLIVALPTLLANSKYSREFEKEADDYAYHYLTANNIDISSFANMLERITEDSTESGLENYLSSHPSTADRLQRFK